jgi:hypothetical protein
MDFFNSIGNALNPNTNGLTTSINNNSDIQKIITSLNGIGNNSTVKNIFQNTNPHNINNFLDKLKHDLAPNNITHTFNTSINPKDITKTIITDPTINKILIPVQPTLQPIMKQIVDPIVNKLPTTINPTDITNSSIEITNQVGGAINDALKPSIK